MIVLFILNHTSEPPSSAFWPKPRLKFGGLHHLKGKKKKMGEGAGGRYICLCGLTMLEIVLIQFESWSTLV